MFSSSHDPAMALIPEARVEALDNMMKAGSGQADFPSPWVRQLQLLDAVGCRTWQVLSSAKTAHSKKLLHQVKPKVSKSRSSRASKVVPLMRDLTCLGMIKGLPGKDEVEIC